MSNRLSRLPRTLLSRRQQNRRVHERRLALDHAGQERHGLREAPGLQIETAKHEVEANVEPLAAGLLERGDGPGRVAGGIVALAHGKPAFGEGGVDRAENPVRLLIGAVPRESGLGVHYRFEGIVLTRIEAGELGAQLRRPGIKGNRPLVCLDGLVNAARALEMPRQQKVVGRIVRLSAGRRSGRLTRCRRSDGDQKERRKDPERPHLPDYNDVSRPRDANGIWYSAPSMPVDPELLEILACPNCKTKVELVKNGAALKCGQCKRVYPIKDDIPVMLLDEATVEP